MIDIGYVLAGTASLTLGVVLGVLARQGVLGLDGRRDRKRRR